MHTCIRFKSNVFLCVFVGVAGDHLVLEDWLSLFVAFCLRRFALRCSTIFGYFDEGVVIVHTHKAIVANTKHFIADKGLNVVRQSRDYAKIKKKVPRINSGTFLVCNKLIKLWCAREDLNLHALAGTST